MVLQYTCMCTVYKICILYMYLIYANVIPNDSVWRMFNPKTEGQPIKIDVDRILDMVLMFYIHLEPNWPLFSGGSPLIFMGWIFQNAGQLGSRYLLILYTHESHDTNIIPVNQCARMCKTGKNREDDAYRGDLFTIRTVMAEKSRVMLSGILKTEHSIC